MDGAYVIRLTVTDKAGNSAYDDMQLIWDTIPPIIRWNTKADKKSNPVGGWFYQNLTAIDANLADMNCTITNSSEAVVWSQWWNLLGYTNVTLGNLTNLEGWVPGDYTENCVVRDLTSV
jgi:hypothetical protein